MLFGKIIWLIICHLPETEKQIKRLENYTRASKYKITKLSMKLNAW